MQGSPPRSNGPEHARRLFQDAVLRHQAGALDEAARLYRSVLAIEPEHVVALARLGAVLNAAGRPEEALAAFDRALTLDPRQADVLNGRGAALTRLGRLDEALASYDLALAERPDHVPALSNRGAALRDLGRPAEALASYDRALAARPDHVVSLNNRGVALIDLKRPADAVVSFERALALKPDYAEALNNRGKALASREGSPAASGEPLAALESFNKAIALDPGYAEAHDNRGLLLFELGRFDEAAAAFERAIALAPRRTRFYYHLAEVRRFEPGDPRLAAMQALGREPSALTPDERIDLDFALGKAFADIGDHARSIQRLLDGNALKRLQIDYDEAAVLGALGRTRAAFTTELMQRKAGQGEMSELPVFIVGMPRSGTTLVEQILASHPGVFAAGETQAFGAALKAQAIGFPEGAAGLSGEGLKGLGGAYLARVRPTAPDAARIVDKRPDNFRFAGLIHLALPGAKIIHLRRDPLDTCVSCFSKLFGQDFAYSFDLGELGRYHLAYAALMAHWRRALPDGAMLEVRYEDLVADLEGQTRRILAYCGLDWDPRCLDFHLTQRRLATASATQVRRPIYGHAVGRWRAYQPYLAPLLEALAAAVPPVA